MSRVIDYDRGVLINLHPRTGMNVFMYVDEPGVYLTAHGTPVSDKLAQESGYDVEKLGKEKLRRDRQKAALKAIDIDMLDDKDKQETVLKEVKGFKLVHIGLGNHNVLDPEGNKLNPMPLSHEIADHLIDAMTGEKEVKPAVVGKK